jgi:hypothetical protein
VERRLDALHHIGLSEAMIMTIRRFSRSRQSTLPYPATLDLIFIGRDTLDPRITFTRNNATTCATYFDSAGVLQSAEINTFFSCSLATLEALRRLNLPEPDYEG